jgi:hypothetical protein
MHSLLLLLLLLVLVLLPVPVIYPPSLMASHQQHWLSNTWCVQHTAGTLTCSDCCICTRHLSCCHYHQQHWHL